MGVERARGEVEAADAVLLVLDASQPLREEDRALLRDVDERYIPVSYTHLDFLRRSP